MMFWTFGTLDFFRPGEINNTEVGAYHGDDYSEEAGAAGEEDHGAEATPEGAGKVLAASEEGGEGEAETHGVVIEPYSYLDENVELRELGVFGQARRMLEDQDHQVDFGPFSLGIEATLVLITLFMLVGAAGKSAQIPLFVWLPDAMAGPTPVSALIHAATMVTAGVYMMVRANVFFSAAELTSFIVTLVGAGTAITAGFIAIGQFDIKRVLAYSTVSQLGFMVAAVGLGAYVAAMFHMVTHAFFKALLFLGSGSVIHGMEHGHHALHGHDHGHDDHEHDDHGHDSHGHDDHGHDDHALEAEHAGDPQSRAIVVREEEFDPQDMRNMGGLSKKMPITYWTYLLGTLALAGIFPFAGFWSKDEILADAWLVGFEDSELKGFIALGLLLAAAGFTAFYMWRQIEMVFHGRPRTEAAEHAHESPPVMTIPLMILAFFSVFIGFINLPSDFFILSGLFGEHVFADFLEHSIAEFHLVTFQPLIAILALAIGLGAIFFARSIYGGVKAVNARRHDPLQDNPSFGAVWSLANARLYWDEIYFRLIENPFNRTAAFLANVIDWNFFHDYFHNTVIYRGFHTTGRLLSKPVDLGLIDGLVNGVGWAARQISGGLRRVQTGYVRVYAVMLLLGVVAVVVIMLWPLIGN
jgi:NADH-quinone oxidoreductase subunit L